MLKCSANKANFLYRPRNAAGKKRKKKKAGVAYWPCHVMEIKLKFAKAKQTLAACG